MDVARFVFNTNNVIMNYLYEDMQVWTSYAIAFCIKSDHEIDSLTS